MIYERRIPCGCQVCFATESERFGAREPDSHGRDNSADVLAKGLPLLEACAGSRALLEHSDGFRIEPGWAFTPLYVWEQGGTILIIEFGNCRHLEEETAIIKLSHGFWRVLFAASSYIHQVSIPVTFESLDE